jgi:hypothetical protein
MDTSDKSKTVATIDVNIVPKVSKATWMEEAMNDHLLCVLCGSAMTFKHKTDFITNTVCEDAHCSACGVRNRQSVYTLQ